MPRSRSCLAAFGLTFGLSLPALAASAPTRPEDRYPETLAPPRTQQIPFEKRTLAPGEQPDPEALARDPKLLGSWLEQHPERLDATKMEPGLVLTIASLLLQNGRMFEAERLLHQALGLWPDNLDVARRWTNIVMRLDRTDAALPVLERLAPATNEAAVYYLLGTAYLRREPRSENDLRGALASWEKVLAVKPDFRDPDGTTAEQLRNAIEKLKKDLPPVPAPVEVSPVPAPPVSAPAPASAAAKTPKKPK